MITQDAINTIVRMIAERFSPQKIILFGSYISGHPTPDSDLDLFLILDTDLPTYKRAAPVRLLLQPAPCPMDIVVYTPAEVAYWNGTVNHIVTEVMRHRIILYEHPQPRPDAAVASESR